MQPGDNPSDLPSADGDRPRRPPDATGLTRWTSPVPAGVEWNLTGGALEVRFSGEICTWSARRMEPVLRAVISSVDPAEIDIDLSAVTFFDARGVSLLVGVEEWASERHRSCEVVRSSEVSRRVLAMCGFDTAGVFDATR